MSHISTKPATAASIGAIISLTTDDLNVVLPDAAGNIDVVGAHGLNTSGAVANEVSIQIDNTITLGDLSVVTTGNDAVTITSGDITLSGTGANAAGNINMPDTGGTTAGDIGVINWGSTRFIHNFGTQNIFAGSGAGNFTQTGMENVAIGDAALDAVTTASFTTAIGSLALSAKTSGGFCVAIGSRCLENATTGGGQTVVGHAACQDMITGADNCVMGTNAMTEATTASRNLALGTGADTGGANEKGPLFKLASGVNNIAIGCSTSSFLTGPGFNYTGSESDNILIGGATLGTLGESNVMRLGTTGSGEGQVDTCYIAGIDGVNVGLVAKVLTMASDQVGTATITAGTNITVTPGANTITIASIPGITWNEETGTSNTMAVDQGYVSSNAGLVTLTLPDTAVFGSIIRVVGKGAGGWLIAQNAGESIIWDEASSTTVGVGGSLASSDDFDSVEILCTVANTTWTVLSSKGNITVV